MAILSRRGASVRAVIAGTRNGVGLESPTDTGATARAVAAGTIGNPTVGMMTVVDALLERDALAGLAKANRVRRQSESGRRLGEPSNA